MREPDSRTFRWFPARHNGFMIAESGLELLRSARYGRPLTGADFDGLDLSTAVVTGARLKRCSFVGSDLRQATLDNCHLTLCDLRTVNLRGSSLRHASFAGCDLRDADLRDCDLTGSRFSYMNTGQANGLTDVTGAHFAGATLRNVTFERVIGYQNV